MYLGITQRGVAYLCRTGKLPARRNPTTRAWEITQTDLDRYLTRVTPARYVQLTGYSIDKIRLWLRRGYLVGNKVGGTWYIDVKASAPFLKTRRPSPRKP